ncbi:T9SS type A sorting domain-containing protein [Bacteroidota bacterium]
MFVKKKAFYIIPFLGLFIFLSSPIFSQQFGDLVNVSNATDIIDTLPAIAVDKDNHVHIAWNGFYYDPEAPDNVTSDIFYTNNKGGSFAAPIQINVPQGWYSREPTIAVDSAGNAHIAFRRSTNQMTILAEDDIYYVTNEDGSFDNPILLVDGVQWTSDMAPHFPRIHCDSQDHIHLLYRAGNLVYMNNITGVWSDREVAVANVGGWINEYNSNYCLDRQGHVHIVLGGHEFPNRDFIYYTNNTGGEFLTPTLASSSEHDHASEPDVAVDSLGFAHIVYRYFYHTVDTPSLFYVNNVSGSFSSWTAICDDKYYYLPSIAVDDSDFVHIAYKRWMNIPPMGGNLFYGNNINGDFDFISWFHSDRARYRWYPGTRYFVLGESPTIHFAFYDWIDPDTEIFYLPCTWATVGIEEEQIMNIPTKYILYQNYPNPFNPSTTIKYSIPKQSFVKLRIFDAIGREIKTLVSKEQSSGYYGVEFDGSTLSSGVYFYRLQTGDYVETKKMILMK